MARRHLTAVLLLAVLKVPTAHALETTFETMLGKLTDMKRLAWLPEPGETCKQFSSYDPKSKYDVATDEYVDWGANGDCGNFLRQEPAGHVLAEMEGPGCIVRIWSANPAGTLKLFFDGEAKPRFVADFPKLIAGEIAPLAPPIVGTQARGANCFVPFPYAKSCKVVVENPGRLYYHVNYRTYPQGTDVRTFAWPLREFEKEALAAATRKLAQCRPLPAMERLGMPRVAKRAHIAPGAAVEVARLTGRRAIRALAIARPPAADRAHEERILRQLTLELYWDGEDTPSVCTPLGDFFGTAPGFNSYLSYPLGMTEDGQMYSRWYMPFLQSARVAIRNEGKTPVLIDSQVWHDGHSIPEDKLAYFHAKWRREYPNQVFDWPMLECTGRGRYVGVSLVVWNPVRGWWGEGDEKVYVDGEKFPSTFGTGSEDYFGYAWCCTDRFVHALHNQPLCEGPRNGNYTSVNRWHLTDDIPFQKSFRITLENYGRDKDYASVAYWYAAHPQTDFFEPLPLEARTIHERWAPPPPLKVEGAIEGEKMQIVRKQTTGALDPQDLSGYSGGRWSGGTHLWFRPPKAGEWFELAVPSDAAGKRKLIGYFTKARDYGIGQLWWNGTKVGKPIDAFNTPAVVATGPLEVGVVEAKKGDNVLRVEVIGKNEKSIGFMFGVDCVVLKPE